MSVPTHLTISIADLPFDQLLADWRWLVPKEFTPVLVTAFGDLFLRNGAGQIHLLDLMSGELKGVAKSQSEFERACEDPEQAESWFLGLLLEELNSEHGSLPGGKCYSCKIPLSLGGKLEADNFEPIDLLVHFSVLGQVHKQTKKLPPGTKIQGVNVVEAKEAKPKSFWQRITGKG